MSKATKEQLVQPSDYMDYDWVKPQFQSYETQQKRNRGHRFERAARHADEYSRDIHNAKTKNKRAQNTKKSAKRIQDFQLEHLAKVA